MRFLVTGASGLLGAELVRVLRAAGQAVRAWSGATAGEVAGVPLRPIDLADPDATAVAFHEDRPDVVLHAAALARVADCHARPEQARRINEEGTRLLDERTDAAGARLVLVSTDLVFDGERGRYREGDAPAPLSVYGRSKLAAERAVLAARRSAVCRVSLLVGVPPFGRPSFFVDQAQSLRQGRRVLLFADEWRTPMAAAAAAQALFHVARSDVAGLLHLGGPERLSRLEMGLRLAARLGADPGLVAAVRQADTPAPEPRPRDVSLDSALWRSLFPHSPWPRWDDTIDWRSIGRARSETGHGYAKDGCPQGRGRE